MPIIVGLIDQRNDKIGHLQPVHTSEKGGYTVEYARFTTIIFPP